MSFPKKFLWGAASAAYQSEGAVAEDGRTPSIWDTFSHTPGKVRYDETGDVTIDSYHHRDEDIELLKSMNLKTYRFSTAWPRIFPHGGDVVNDAGFAWYDGLVDSLLAADIAPSLTLYHWDLPQPLQDNGGWLNPETAVAFARYAEVVAQHFKGRVKQYITINEIECIVRMGYGTGEHAPGYKLDEAAQFTAWHNVIYAHCLACKAIRAIDPDATVGIATTGRVCAPANAESPADVAAARKAMFTLEDGEWGFTHTLALDPVCLGAWPKAEGENLARSIAAVPAEQLAALPDGKPDFIGLNIYNGSTVKAGANGPEYLPYPTGGPRTALKWPITPDCLEWGPRFIGERYNLPMYITENGLSCMDKVYLDGAVHDADRIDFLTRYLRALHAGIEAGADVRGYFHWALLDNYEWMSGYDERFGLVYVDYPTGTRLPKDSARWYAEVARTNGESLG